MRSSLYFHSSMSFADFYCVLEISDNFLWLVLSCYGGLVASLEGPDTGAGTVHL